MRLLDDVRLIESEVLAPPTASTFERSIIKLASYLITGRKHALIKKYALNKHVRLLTRLYGNNNRQPKSLFKAPKYFCGVDSY